MATIRSFIRREPVLLIAALAAAVSCFFVPPDARYLSYIDFRTLALLYCLMTVVAGLRQAGLFAHLAHMLCRRVSTLRAMSALLVALCFFSAMLITNDVALLTFVPFAVVVLGMADQRDALIRENPAFEKEIRMALHPEWVKIHIRKEDSIAYLYELKSRGYRIYILSNLAKESYEYVRGFEFFREIDGGVFSYQERVIKPDEKIYRILLDRYALKPEETLFFDDVPENIEAARRLGIHGIVFTDLSAAKTQAEQLLNP